MYTCCGNCFETLHKGHRIEGEPTRGSCSSHRTCSSLLSPLWFKRALLPNLGGADFHSIVPGLPHSAILFPVEEKEVLLPAAVPSTVNWKAFAGTHTHTHTHIQFTTQASSRPLPLPQSSVQDAPASVVKMTQGLVEWNPKHFCFPSPNKSRACAWNSHAQKFP